MKEIMLCGPINIDLMSKNKIEQLGYKIIYQANETEKCSYNQDDIEIIVCNSFFIYNKIQSFKSLRLIVLTSAGLDRVDLNYINENKISLVRAMDVYNKPMAEYVLTYILIVIKRALGYYENQKQHIWEKNREMHELTDKKVGIIGYGNVGSTIGKYLDFFGCNIFAIDKKPLEEKYYTFIPFSNLESVINNMDIIIIAMPLLDDNQGIINKSFFDRLKSNIIIINVSRGKLINTVDLINFLDANIDATAILDVFEEEPLNSNSKLWDLQNVIITPHVSFISNNNDNKLNDYVVNSIVDYLKGINKNEI